MNGAPKQVEKVACGLVAQALFGAGNTCAV